MKLRSILAMLTLFPVACGAPRIAPSEPDPTQGTIAAAARPAVPTPEFVGVISSRVSKVIAADFDARVERLAIRSGQRVKAGEIVAELDASELVAKLDQAKGSLAQARGRAARAGAAYVNSSRQLQSYQKLLSGGVIAAAELDSKRAELNQYGGDSASASGEIASAQSQIAELERLLARAHVPAPIDGVVSIVKVQEGQIAQRGTAIARVFDPDQPVVRFAVPTSFKTLVPPGARVDLVLAGESRSVPASVVSSEDDHDPSIQYTVCEAAIDPGFPAAAIHIGDNGHVKLATAGARR